MASFLNSHSSPGRAPGRNRFQFAAKALFAAVAFALAGSTAHADSNRAPKAENLGEIRGQVYGCTAPYFGATAFIPGTAFQARADSDGRFRLLFVLPGAYSVSFDRAGEFLRSVPGVRVRGGKVLDMGRITLCDDNDGDGADQAHDCNDSSATVFPGAEELCNGIDDDCDAVADDGIDLQLDAQNCGACGVQCAAEERCRQGMCEPLPHQSNFVIIAGNIDADTVTDATQPTSDTNFSVLYAEAEFSTSLTLVDSLGAAHTATIYFFHTGNNLWLVRAYVDAGHLGGVSGAAQAIGSTSILFDNSGQRVAPVPQNDFTATPAWSNGSVSLPITFSFTPLTQYSTSSAITSITTDGAPR